MIQRKRLLAAGIAASLVFAACGSSSDDKSGDDTASEAAGADSSASESEGSESEGQEAPSSDVTVGLTFDIGGRGDQSFNDSAAAGIERAAAELGITFNEAEPNADGSNRAELLQLQADQHDLVLAIGFLFEADVVATAAENPDVKFAVVDSAMLDFDNGGVPYADNVQGLTFAENEGSFLVGVAAALNSKTNTVGFIGGVGGFGLIERFEAGFTAGVKAVNPDITVIPQYITQAPDFEGFFAADRAKEIALGMYDQGADVIYHAAGGSGAGLFEAAKERSEASGTKVWAIGVDSDQYLTSSEDVRDYILTSMLKRVDVAVFEATKAQTEGNFTPGNIVYDLAAEGVGYATTGDFLTQDVIDTMEDYKAKIIAGEIEVPMAPEG
ncbi:MAG: BMP family ABC transporter substrate-binding protein [Ilumatobacter coccineus]|uniref:BMP family ABC transporter substrate-binding protein n=1 Tax=Ilumatobacter coccineus TaxID=467094 RepID=A0A2G6KAG8_9ACTN|nr:MAG: BMP family ABC transporter substrate-binding protein [Ilumatobacter coccineus]